ncbi:MAG: flagellin [Proteobacteria bacterium]|nr:MAG: flagellin [Pseudomonadota bacterium]PIE67148.1 MAG: flagellin [Deltaproteobacteria bacterium]
MTIALTSGMRSNLIALQNVDSMMQTTQNRLSTGKRVNSALDDPVNFFKAQDNYNRASDLAAKKDGMGEAIKIIETANSGIEKMEDLLNQMKSLASAAKTSDNVEDLENQYNTVLEQVSTLAQDSNYGGQNLTYRESGNNESGETATQIATNELSVEFNEYAASNSAGSSLDVQGFSVNRDSSSGDLTIKSSSDSTSFAVTIADVDASDDSTRLTSAANVDRAIESIDNFIGQLRTEAQKLSSSLSTIQIRSDFTSEMVNTLNTGADNLTLADMNEEGANMLMLQTRQNLGTTSLSLASQAAQAVLQLF